MLPADLNLKEEGYLGDEFFKDDNAELAFKCRMVQDTVTGSIFTVEEALAAYEVSKEVWLAYVINDLYMQMKSKLLLNSPKEDALIKLKAAAQLMQAIFGTVEHEDLKFIYQGFSRFENDIRQEKVKLDHYQNA